MHACEYRYPSTMARATESVGRQQQKEEGTTEPVVVGHTSYGKANTTQLEQEGTGSPHFLQQSKHNSTQLNSTGTA